MYIRSKLRTVIAITLATILIIMLLPLQQTYAAELVKIPDSNAYLKVINENKIQVIEGNKVSDITVMAVSEDITEVKVSEPGRTERVFTANSAEGTVTTDTGLKINIAEDELQDEKEITTNSAKTEAYKSKTVTKKYSYAKIKSALEDTATIATIASVLLVFIAAAGYSVPATLSILVTLLSALPNLIPNVKKGSSKHGVKIKLKSYMRTSTKNGKEYKYEAWKPVSVSKY
ncbi:hypothetical protein [Hornefia butyriciproducens]|uniref:Uncharacterized protein n=1 Tax=Hornefia butyriciproducens TaxID=2652293 RepID=A0A6L5Y702_9FIRM|nr:hypothetical protein [Hornefia butyriciproducens]MST52406.1 hypothetical protein [Hornefia butyriciproducens]